MPKDPFTSIFIEPAPDFSFDMTIRSHGWYDLPPFELDEETSRLSYVFDHGQAGVAMATINEQGAQLRIDVDGNCDRERLVRDIRHLLRLDDDLSAFYCAIERIDQVAWASRQKAGRLLRSPTVYEDLVKTICTTNCSWSLTRKMVSMLVEHLGTAAPNGKKAFPTPAAMASMPAEFYRDVVRAGYRSPYFAELASRVVNGELDPESWLISDLSTAELKKEMKKVKGVGDYAAENLLKLVGRYDGLALDSWLRVNFYEKHNKGKRCPDKKIERHYRKFGEWQGLAIWCDMTESWFEQT